MVYRKQKKFNVGAANLAKKTICLLLVVCLAVVFMPQVALADEATLNGAAASNVEQVVNVQGDADLQSAATGKICKAHKLKKLFCQVNYIQQLIETLAFA